jgi:hypothetical protein
MKRTITRVLLCRLSHLGILWMLLGIVVLGNSVRLIAET